MTQPKDIIDELRRSRVSQGIAQFDLAEVSGYNRGTIAKYETGRGTPSLHMACNWAESLGCKLVLVKK
jgi:transcriptional regulator with XRE-family HTH domain